MGSGNIAASSSGHADMSISGKSFDFTSMFYYPTILSMMFWLFTLKSFFFFFSWSNWFNIRYHIRFFIVLVVLFYVRNLLWNLRRRFLDLWTGCVFLIVWIGDGKTAKAFAKWVGVLVMIDDVWWMEEGFQLLLSLFSSYWKASF